MSGTPSKAGLWAAVGAAAVVAGVGGFGLARLTGGGEKAPAAAPAAAPPPGKTEVVVPPANMAAMQIGVETVSAGAFDAEIQAAGLVQPAPQGEAVVTAQAAGTILRLNKRLGDPVRAGEVLAQVASREASTMSADRSVANARAALARSVLAREQRLFEQRVSPRQDLEKAQAELAAAEAEARRAQGAATTAHLAGDGRSLVVISPIAGRITAESAALGAFVQPETELYRVADPRFIQVEAAVTAADAVRVRPGDAAQVATAAGTRAATVRSVTPTLDVQTRAATVVLTLANGGAALAPGEAVQVRISPKTSGPIGVAVPDDAIQTVAGGEVVFVRTAAGFRAQPVTVAARANGRASIASGLAAGQVIAVRNAFLLKAELTKGAGEEE